LTPVSSEAFRIIAETANIERIIIFQNVYPEEPTPNPSHPTNTVWVEQLGAEGISRECSE
jgi:hypothetical protein